MVEQNLSGLSSPGAGTKIRSIDAICISRFVTVSLPKDVVWLARCIRMKWVTLISSG